MDFLKRKRKEPKFEVATRGEGVVRLTARELAERVAKDAAASDYNWIAPAAELLWVTGQEGFDRESERRILTRMLNCYAHLLGPMHDVYANDCLHQRC